MHAIEPHPILFVDDEESNRLLVETTLSDTFEVLIASSGAEALEVLEHQPVDVLLTDHRMPGMTGVQLCQHVARTHPHVQRLLVTAYVDTASAVQAINQGGVSRYLSKPWDLDDLIATIREAQSTAVRGRLTAQLQSEILLRERMAALASMQGRVLHDLGNAAYQLQMGCAEIADLLAGLQAAAPPAVYGDLQREVDDMKVAVGFLTELHTHVRGLHRSNATKPERLVVADMLHSASVLGRASLPSGARIEVQADARLAVMADRTDVGRILVNLVTNAAQALADARSRDGRIWLAAERLGDLVHISVKDNGPGIPEEVRPRIFEDHFTTKGDQGSGIGLSTSRRLAEDNGGSLQLADEGAGACLRLALPAADPTPAGAQSPLCTLADPVG
ncbi:MAG: response regulator [Myxococcales bacterium]|nr:response regulator [Myxococcales bacterium]